MEVCENMKGWRRHSRAGALKSVIGVMLLGLRFTQSVHPQATCSAPVTLQNLTQPNYEVPAKEVTGVGFMSAFVQSFLNTVQPNPLPRDLILRIVRLPENVLSNEEIKKVLVYEVGFLVCVAIGVLYIVLMPIVGLFLACCRCCGNCGGKLYQKQTSSVDCLRRTLYLSALVTTIIIFAGNICMFRSNETLKMSMRQSPEELNKTIDNIYTFITAVPQQVDFVVNESYKTVQEVNRNLDAIGTQLGTEIQQRFRGTLDPALQSVRHLDQEFVNMSVQLNKLNSSLAQLQSSMDHLHHNVTDVKNKLNDTMSNPNCLGCTELTPELEKLTLDSTITAPSLLELQSALDEVIKINLQSKIDEIEEYLHSIPQRVTNDTKDVVQKSKQQLEDIKEKISQLSSQIQLSELDDVAETLNQVKGEMERVLPEAERAEYIRWSVCKVMCCVVLLVVVCNLLGLVLGPLGLTPKADPKKRSCTADCGGTFLMMGAGFSFLFSWLFMIAVLLLFILGGNIYTVICRSWKNGQLLELIDDPGFLEGLNINPALGLKANVSFSDIYRDCEINQPVWTTFHLDEHVDLEDLLNVSKYTAQVQQDFENIDITLPSVTLLSPEVKNQLSKLSAKAESLNATAFTEQIKNFSSINLNTTADKLDNFARNQTVDDTRNELYNEAIKLRQIQADIETIIIPQLENLNSAIKSTVEKLNRTLEEDLGHIRAAQDILNTNTTQIIKTESRKFLDCQLDYFTAYADWARLMITQQVGRCGPVASAVDSAEVILCANVVEALNAFWFSLGWCMIFFIPSIIFTIKLAKYYRRMKYSDVFDNHIIMNHIPRAQMKFT
ncbi:prominin-2 [Melanotaenia boesemani]|uniref:prominin-2 n=1 Tax=Melanotaenia boesemani TaxID=1250792 RepID=UPI001C03B122|nr:prominin-2 [Melanotaenia boesemani]